MGDSFVGHACSVTYETISPIDIYWFIPLECRRIQSAFFPLDITAIFPCARIGNISMFDRVEVDVMQMVFEITVIADDMIPKAFLPEFH